MKKNVLEKLALILSIVLYLVPKYIAPICGPKEDGSYMSCFYSGHMVMKLSVIIFVILFVMVLYSDRCKYFKIFGSLAVIVISALVYMIPHGLTGLQNEIGHPYGMCRMDTMMCQVHHTFDISTGIAIVIGLLMVFNLISAFMKKD